MAITARATWQFREQSRCEATWQFREQSRCEATRQHRPILTGVDGDDTTTQHISRCEAWSHTQAKQVWGNMAVDDTTTSNCVSHRQSRCGATQAKQVWGNTAATRHSWCLCSLAHRHKTLRQQHWFWVVCSGSKALTSIDANITVICTVYSTVIAACKWWYQQPQQKDNEGLTHYPMWKWLVYISFTCFHIQYLIFWR